MKRIIKKCNCCFNVLVMLTTTAKYILVKNKNNRLKNSQIPDVVVLYCLSNYFYEKAIRFFFPF